MRKIKEGDRYRYKNSRIDRPGGGGKIYTGKGGRPSEYCIEVAETICRLLIEGNSLFSICKRKDMPDVYTIYAWMRRHPEFEAMYKSAREDQSETGLDRVREIARDKKLSVERAKLMIKTEQWLASKMKPTKYGNQLALTGPNGGPLVPQATTIILDFGEGNG